MNGIGWTPVGPVNGTWILIGFADEEQQQPLMLGTLPGIPQSKAGQIAVEESDDAVVVTDGGGGKTQALGVTIHESSNDSHPC
jgi:hypothetical protein